MVNFGWFGKQEDTTEIKDDILYHPRSGTGTYIEGGYYYNDYLGIMNGQQKADAFDKMRLGDGKIRAVLNALKNPIKAATYSIESVNDDDEEKEIADFVSHVLFEDIGDERRYKTFDELISEVLTMLDFGYSLFEISHKIVRNDPDYGDYIGLRNISMRNQRTIEKWNLAHDGVLKSVYQQADGDVGDCVTIDGRFLIVFTNEKEGDNYEGLSVLRPIYGNWLRKNVFKKIQAVGHERASIGTPTIELSEDVQDKQANYNAAVDAIDAFFANEGAGLVAPAGAKIGEIKISFDAEALNADIAAENAEMVESILANFLLMGVSGNGGAYSLGTDSSDMFLSSLQGTADYIATKINKEIIEFLVKAKFGKRAKYPKLRITGINDKVGKETAEILEKLSKEGLLQKSDALIKQLASEFNLPYDEDYVESETKEETKSNELSEVKLAEGGIPQVKKSVKTIDESADIIKLFMVDSLMANANDYKNSVTSTYKLAASKRRDAGLSLSMKGKNAYKKELKLLVANTANKAKKDVLIELGLSQSTKLDELQDVLATLPVAARDELMSAIDMIVNRQYADIEDAVGFTFNTKLTQAKSAEEMNALLTKQIDKYVQGNTIGVGAVNLASQAVNTVRQETYLEPEIENGIESFVFYNPNPISAICQNLNGKVFSKEEYHNTTLLPPMHHNCKSIIYAQNIGGRNNKPLSPAGLSLTGTEEEIGKMQKQQTL